MKKPENVSLPFLTMALLAVCFGHVGSAFAQNGGPTDASATITLLEGIDSARSQPGHQYRAVLDKPISVSGISVPRGTPAIVVLTQARAGSAAIWTLQLTGFVVGGAPVAVTGTSPTLPKTFGNVLGAVNSAGRATAAGLRVFLQPEQVVTFALGTPMGGGSMTVQGAPQGSSPMVQEQSGIRLELTGCTKEGTRVDCEFFATNVTANDFNLGFCDGNGGNFHGSYLIDQLGNKLLNPAWTLGSTNGNSGNRQLMLPGVRTTLSFVFQPLDARAVSLLRLDLAYSNIPHQSCQNDFIFSGIPIPDHVASTSPPATGTYVGSNAAAPASTNSSMQVRGQIGYSLQGCADEASNIVCTIGTTALVANPRHVVWDNTNSYIVDTSGNKKMVSQMHFGDDPTTDAVLMQGQAIPLRLVFINTSNATSLARLELVGNDGSALSARWTNVPVLPEQTLASSTASPQQADTNAHATEQVADSLPPPRPGDPAGFEVLNVRLGMSAKEAINALQKRFGVLATSGGMGSYNPDHAVIVYNLANLNSAIHAGVSANAKYTTTVWLNDTSRLSVVYRFIPDSPLHSTGKTELLNDIEYTSPAETPADMQQFHDDLVQHYGESRRITDGNVFRTAMSALEKPWSSYQQTSGAIVMAEQASISKDSPAYVWCGSKPSTVSAAHTLQGCQFPMAVAYQQYFAVYDRRSSAEFEKDAKQFADKQVTLKNSTF